MKIPRTVVIRGGQPVELYDDDDDGADSNKASNKTRPERTVASGAQRYWSSPAGQDVNDQLMRNAGINPHETATWVPPNTGSSYAKGGPVTKASYKHSDPNHLNFGKSGDSALLAKQRRGYAEGGEVEFDPNASTRAGSRQYGVDEKGQFWGWKEKYPRQQELTPSESKDRNRQDPEDVMPDIAGQKYRTSET